MHFTFNHHNFNVLSLERSLEFYQKALGLRELRRKEPADGSFFTFTIYFFAFKAASTNPLNSGCGRFGLDFSSG